MSSNIVSEWRENGRELDMEEVIESDLSPGDIRRIVENWSKNRKIDFMYEIVPSKNEKNHDLPPEKKLTTTLTKLIKLVKTNRIHRKKLYYQKHGELPSSQKP